MTLGNRIHAPVQTASNRALAAPHERDPAGHRDDPIAIRARTGARAGARESPESHIRSRDRFQFPLCLARHSAKRRAGTTDVGVGLGFGIYLLHMGEYGTRTRAA